MTMKRFISAALALCAVVLAFGAPAFAVPASVTPAAPAVAAATKNFIIMPLRAGRVANLSVGTGGYGAVVGGSTNILNGYGLNVYAPHDGTGLNSNPAVLGWWVSGSTVGIAFDPFYYGNTRAKYGVTIDGSPYECVPTNTEVDPVSNTFLSVPPEVAYCVVATDLDPSFPHWVQVYIASLANTDGHEMLYAYIADAASGLQPPPSFGSVVSQTLTTTAALVTSLNSYSNSVGVRKFDVVNTGGSVEEVIATAGGATVYDNTIPAHTTVPIDMGVPTQSPVSWSWKAADTNSTVVLNVYAVTK